MRSDSFLMTICVGLVAWTTAPPARAQVETTEFEVPAGSLVYEDTGTLEAVQPDVIRMRDSKNEPWLMNIDPHTQVAVEGEAEVSYLRPGVFVQFTGALNKKGLLTAPVKEIEIFSAEGRSTLGLFAAGDSGSAARPVRNPGAGTYVIKGKVASFKGDELVVIAGRTKISAKLDESLETIKVNLDDPSIAQTGDAVKVKAWYYDRGKPNPLFSRPGTAKAQEITITLAKPLAGTMRRARPADKPARATSKSSKISK